MEGGVWGSQYIGLSGVCAPSGVSSSAFGQSPLCSAALLACSAGAAPVKTTGPRDHSYRNSEREELSSNTPLVCLRTVRSRSGSPCRHTALAFLLPCFAF